MPGLRPFRFGVQLVGDRPTPTGWVDLARRVEALGYSTLTMPDHFNDQLAPMPALQAVADATTTLRVGALVFDNDYKHPRRARQGAGHDGRAVATAGSRSASAPAGWRRDYEQAGHRRTTAPACASTGSSRGSPSSRGVMGDGPFSFAGEHYTITDYDGLPKPVQSPHPPILIGGGGPRVLSIAAREADIVGINGTLHAGVDRRRRLATMTAERSTTRWRSSPTQRAPPAGSTTSS